MFLSNFEYTIIHISGENICWADLLSRWGSAKSSSDAKERHFRLSALLRAPLAPETKPDFSWPTVRDIAAAQKIVTTEEHSRLELKGDNGVLRMPSGAVWIPKEDTTLQLRICIVGHCGRGGHRASDATKLAVHDFCFWETMATYITAFCQSCLQCELTLGGK